MKANAIQNDEVRGRGEIARDETRSIHPDRCLEEDCQSFNMRRNELDFEERERLSNLVIEVENAFDRLKVGLASLRGIQYSKQPR